MKTPQRQTLITQTVDALREGIDSGIWKNALPGERELCRRFQVSRPTLRAALEIVHREGLIAVLQEKRSAILKRRRPRLRAIRECVALISKVPLHSMSRNRIFLIDDMLRVLQEQGLRCDAVLTGGSAVLLRPLASGNCSWRRLSRTSVDLD
jgi:DNA-binding GntR family transcriptional regulator